MKREFILKPHQFIWKGLILAFISVLFIFPSLTQAEEKILKVGVAFGEPFAMLQHNHYSGIAIDLWEQIAEELNLKFTYVPLGEHIDEAVEKLASGQINVLVGPIVPTYERIKAATFLQPYYLNQIGLIVPVRHLIFFDVLESILNGFIISALLILIFFFALYLHAYWYYELRPYHKEHKAYFNGISEAFWLHTLDIDLGKIPKHPRTRWLRFVWLVLVTIFFSSITAAITSALTLALSQHYTSYTDANELKNKKVAAVMKAAPQDIAQKLGFTHLVLVNKREEAVDLLLKGKVTAYVDYYPVADYYLAQHQLSEKLTTSPNLVIQRNTFAFVLPLNSPLAHLLDLKLSSFKENGLVQVICKKYFQENEKASLDCNI